MSRDYLPQKKTKTKPFTVRVTEDEHEAFLKAAREKGECRAVTFVELAKLGLQVYAKSLEDELATTDKDQVAYKHSALVAAQKVS